MSNKLLLVIVLLFGLVAAAGGPARASRGAVIVAPQPVAPGAHPDRIGTGRYFIGVAIRKIPSVFSRLLGLRSGQGLLVQQVIPASPAAAAGIKAGDLLIALDGKLLRTPRQLVEAVNQPHPGRGRPTVCRLTIIRAGMRRQVNVRPAPCPPQLFSIGRKISIASRTFVPSARQANPGAPGRRIMPARVMTFGPGMVIHLPETRGSPALSSRLPEVFTITQWTDSHGVVHTIINTGDRRYSVDSAHLRTLPPPVQPLARLLLRSSASLGLQRPGAAPANNGQAGHKRAVENSPAAGANPGSPEKQIRKLEAQISVLQARLTRLRKQALARNAASQPAH